MKVHGTAIFLDGSKNWNEQWTHQTRQNLPETNKVKKITILHNNGV